MLILFLLAGRRTDQPQPWALAPALALGALGFALLIITPGNRLLGWMGWIWPILLVLLVVWSVRGARRSLHNWSRRLAALSGACRARTRRPRRRIRDGRRGDDEQRCPFDRAHLPRRWTSSLPELRWLGISDGGALQRARRANAELGCWCRARSLARPGSVPTTVRARVRAAKHRDPRTGTNSPPIFTGFSQRRDVPGPYVVAGHSVGGTYALAYAMDYPKETAGVALIDSASPHQFEDLPDYPGFYSMWRRVGALLPSVRACGHPASRERSGLGRTAS